MAVKIPDLPAASLPLTGAETIPMVQSGTTVQTVTGNFSITQLNVQTGTSYTLRVSDNGGIITLNNASAITLTLPTGLAAGFSCMIAQLGAGQVGVVAAGGATLTSFNSLTHLAGQFAAGTIVVTGTNTFLLAGTLA